MVIEELREKASNLPLSPGVYIMRDKKGEIIYVGKAKHLKNRVSQYFQNTEHSIKVAKMVEHVDNFDIIVADSEFDALVLENILIKKHMPKYNIRLKDDKGYPFIRLDRSKEYPSFEISSKRLQDGAKYFGPYGSRVIAHSVIETLSRTLRLPSCSRVFPRDIGKRRPCINAEMNRCVSVCSGKVSPEEFGKLVKQAELILTGDYGQLVSSLEREMLSAAEEMEFEKAASLRDRLNAIKTLGSKQIIINDNIRDADAAAYYCDETGGAIVMLSLRGGVVVSKFTLFTEETSEKDGGELLSDFIAQYYGDEDDIPSHIFVSDESCDITSLSRLLSEKAGKKVNIAVPKRGEKHAIVDMSLRNARDELARQAVSEQRITKTAADLSALLSLGKAPQRIEAFDISNTGSSDIVASMVVFERGKPLKSAYKKYKIKSTDTQDDFMSIHEVISRRLTALSEGREGFSTAPDLMLIDGGKGQLSSALAAMDELSLHLPVFGMQKDDRHRTSALVTPDGNVIGLSAHPSVFSFIGTIQEEAHRFAIGFHRQKRDKGKIKSSLDSIDGIGAKRRAALLTRFKSVSGVKKASLDDLTSLLGGAAAKSVYDYFHGKDDDIENNNRNSKGNATENP